MRRNRNTPTANYRANGWQHEDRLATFRQQMADYARGELLRKLRDDLHLSQEEAAYRIGVSVKTIRAWEKGGKIRWANAKSAGDIYGVDPEKLVSRDEDGPTIADATPSAALGDDALSLLHQILDQQGELIAKVDEVRDEIERQRKPQASSARSRAGKRN